MKNTFRFMRIFSIPIALGLLYLFSWILGNVVPVIVKFLQQWFLIKQYSSELLPTWVVIIIDLITPCIAYNMVGVIFDILGWYDSKVMHFVNVFITAVIAVGISLFIRFIIEDWWIVLIILSIFLLVFISLGIINKRKDKQNDLNFKGEVKND